jgi:hypothetical protein
MDEVQKPSNSEVLYTIVRTLYNLKQLCLYLYRAKRHLSSETEDEYNNITPDADSDMEHAQPLCSTYWMFWLR